MGEAVTLHEYSVVGHSRAVIGRYLGTVAGILAGGGAIAAGAAFELFDRLGLHVSRSGIVLWPLTVGLIFTAVHFAFDKLLWRWAIVRRITGIPNLNGVWTVNGTTKSEGGADWSGEITITQSWEKIWVFLKTPTSSSRSKAAALLYEPGSGHCLMYSYRNDPALGEPIAAHVGYAELTFNEALDAASGEYFNSKGRTTFGQMSLTRKV
jgi:hypothetical protein